MGEERATSRCYLIIFERKKNKLLKTMTFLKDIAFFSENGVKNDHLMLRKWKTCLWLTSKFQTNKNDIRNITVKHNYVSLHKKNKEKSTSL